MLRAVAFAVAAMIAWPSMAADVLRHDLKISLNPHTHRLDAVDTITFARALAHGKMLRFSLHKGLAPQVRTANVTIEPGAASETESHEEFVLTLPPGAREIQLAYGGEIYHALSDASAEVAGGMRESLGMIGDEGVFLDGATGWYPRFADEMLQFALEARVPNSWDVVSQGARERHDIDGDARVVRWAENHPQDEIYLIAASFTEYTKAADGVQAMVFLREADAKLAQTYLDATVRYVKMYSDLLGDYAYAKFALVENFWESGFGMPSFTLLGPRVLRLPFIVYSSYPHEILHNWWGNGVYVDYARGNWSEGLTSYLADHLLQEQRGDGASYRRGALQKYTDFVSAARDFPLTEFRSRHNSTTEAVGYGKTLMLFHMLRRELGDEKFVQALREFYRRYQFKIAAFDDLKQVFSDVARRNLDAQFDPWVKRTGAPQLRVRDVHARPDGTEFVLSGVIEQIQSDTPFPLYVPLAVHLEGTPAAYQTNVRMNDKQLEFNLRVAARPLRVDVDPEFDLFRRLDRAEIPPALSQVFGAEKVLVLLPFDAPAALHAAYDAAAKTWSGAEPGKIEIKNDIDVKTLPKDRAVWVFGWQNRWRGRVAEALRGYPFAVINQGARIGETMLSKSDHPIVVAARNPANPALGMAWMATNEAAMLPVLARKLPHYAKYSYLGFQGADVANILKGQWIVVDSPLSLTVRQDDGKKIEPSVGTLETRRALIPATAP